MEQVKAPNSMGRLLTFSSNVRLALKELTGKNTITYFDTLLVKKGKMFHNIEPWANVIKLFMGVIYKFLNKLQYLYLASLSSLV